MYFVIRRYGKQQSSLTDTPTALLPNLRCKKKNLRRKITTKGIWSKGIFVWNIIGSEVLCFCLDPLHVCSILRVLVGHSERALEPEKGRWMSSWSPSAWCRPTARLLYVRSEAFISPLNGNGAKMYLVLYFISSTTFSIIWTCVASCHFCNLMPLILLMFSDMMFRFFLRLKWGLLITVDFGTASVNV